MAAARQPRAAAGQRDAGLRGPATAIAKTPCTWSPAPLGGRRTRHIRHPSREPAASPGQPWAQRKARTGGRGARRRAIRRVKFVMLAGREGHSPRGCVAGARGGRGGRGRRPRVDRGLQPCGRAVPQSAPVPSIRAMAGCRYYVRRGSRALRGLSGRDGRCQVQLAAGIPRAAFI